MKKRYTVRKSASRYVVFDRQENKSLRDYPIKESASSSDKYLNKNPE